MSGSGRGKVFCLGGRRGPRKGEGGKMKVNFFGGLGLNEIV